MPAVLNGVHCVVKKMEQCDLHEKKLCFLCVWKFNIFYREPTDKLRQKTVLNSDSQTKAKAFLISLQKKKSWTFQG